jgi:DNA-binding transcriptional regulator YhcF (GntR family)
MRGDFWTGEDLEASLARYLLQVKEGERLITVREIAKLSGTSIGAVSTAISSLEDAGAVKIDRRGHLGSFVENRSVGTLWSIAEKEPMVISFPLIANTRMEGLATGLKKLISRIGIDVYLSNIRGSRTRVQALRENKCHVAVMSEFAANALAGESEQILLRLPPGSYVSSHRVFYRPDTLEQNRPLRVTTDYSSFDIEGLTELEFKDIEKELVTAPFVQLHRILKQNHADVGIWSIDDMQPHLADGSILHRPLSDEVREQVKDADTSAALVVRADSDSVKAVIEAAIDVDEVLEIQRKVLSGDLVPEY